MYRIGECLLFSFVFQSKIVSFPAGGILSCSMFNVVALEKTQDPCMKAVNLVILFLHAF